MGAVAVSLNKIYLGETFKHVNKIRNFILRNFGKIYKFCEIIRRYFLNYEYRNYEYSPLPNSRPRREYYLVERIDDADTIKTMLNNKISRKRNGE